MTGLLPLTIKLLLKRLDLDSRNSCTLPSQDANWKRKEIQGEGHNKGGQKGHKGTTLEKVLDPDETIDHSSS